MPSLLTASRQSQQPLPGSSSSRLLSRVNSFQREWGDDDLPTKGSKSALPSSSGNEIEWSPSPERISTKPSFTNKPQPPPKMPSFSRPHQPSSSSSTMTSLAEAKERRRRAILEAMSQNGGPSSASTSTTTATSSTFSAVEARTSTASSFSTTRVSTNVVAPPASGSRPVPASGATTVKSLVASSYLPAKRGLPWEEDHNMAKRAMSINKVASSTASTSASASSTTAPKRVASPAPQRFLLSTEQHKVLDLVVNQSKNIFYTGSAGTGKSVLLREIIKALKKKHANSTDAVAVTASTGIAACNIGGITLHSFGGVGLGIETAQILAGKVKKNKKAAARWLRTKVLIIDEVSMVDGELFDKLNKIGQIMRKQPNKPFGGMQLIVTGDFFQLPPVTKDSKNPRFCFEAETWKDTIDMSVNLTKVFRQKDERFINILNEMRFGRLTPDSMSTFKALSRPLNFDDGIAATELFPRREDVERANQTRLRALNTEGWTYNSTDGGSLTDPIQREKVLSNMMAPAILEVKVNAQVMLIKNMDETLVNGSMGLVLGFTHKPLYYTDARGKWRPEGPDDDIYDDEGNKVKQLEGTEARAKILETLRSKILPGARPQPVVRFKIPGGGERDVFMEFDTFNNELPNGEVQVSRSQLPLILAWAMSIHKSQGQTLDRVKVDLSKVFEKGQAYVALSRATTLEGLQVTGFSSDKVMAHRKVAEWSKTLRDLNT